MTTVVKSKTSWKLSSHCSGIGLATEPICLGISFAWPLHTSGRWIIDTISVIIVRALLWPCDDVDCVVWMYKGASAVMRCKYSYRVLGVEQAVPRSLLPVAVQNCSCSIKIIFTPVICVSLTNFYVVFSL